MQTGGLTAVELMQGSLDRIITMNDEFALAVPQQFSQSCSCHHAAIVRAVGGGWREIQRHVGELGHSL